MLILSPGEHDEAHLWIYSVLYEKCSVKQRMEIHTYWIVEEYKHGLIGISIVAACLYFIPKFTGNELSLYQEIILEVIVIVLAFFVILGIKALRPVSLLHLYYQIERLGSELKSARKPVYALLEDQVK